MTSLYEQARKTVGDDPAAFMERMDALLKLHGLPHAALARSASIDPALLSKWFRGVKEPSKWTRLRLDDAMQRLLYG